MSQTRNREAKTFRLELGFDGLLAQVVRAHP
jgi:hypothetical protein